MHYTSQPNSQKQLQQHCRILFVCLFIEGGTLSPLLSETRCFQHPISYLEDRQWTQNQLWYFSLPASLTHQGGNTQHCPPALHLEQLQHPPAMFHGYYTCGEELKGLKNSDVAALENLFPNGRCRRQQKAAARTNRQHCLQQAPLLTNTVHSLPLQKGRWYQITKSSVPPFSSFLIKPPAAPTQNGPHLVRCLPDTSVAPAVVALCCSSSNCGGRTICSP